jgi:carboxyl-terminal processing protease
MPVAHHRNLSRHVFAGLMAAHLTAAWAQAQKLTPEVLAEMQKVATVYSMIQTDYVVPIAGTAVMASCMKGMVKGLDGQSSYIDKDQFEDFLHPSTDVVGIGVEMALRAGLPTVVTAIEGSAADRAGLRPKDYILEIDGHSMEEAELQDAFKRLQGKPGSVVALVIRRPGEFVNRSLTLTRTPNRVKAVSARRTSSDMGYLRVRGLYERAASDVRLEFAKLQDARPLRGLVLDLRNSPGGLLESALEVAAMFLPPNAPIASTEGRLPEANQSWTASPDGILKRRSAAPGEWPEAMKSVPLVVLVNGGTASGAEIIAAALKENDRAKLIGSQTFGRGIIQTVRPLSADSAVKLTTAYFKTPSGRRLQGKGLDPDVQAPDPEHLEDAGTDGDVGLSKAIALLKAPS